MGVVRNAVVRDSVANELWEGCNMDKNELTTWALANGWQTIAGHPSLTKPSSPKEAIVRMVLKETVVNLEVK